MRTRGALRSLGLASVLAGAMGGVGATYGCTSSSSSDAASGPPARVCGYTVWHRATDSSVVELVGDFNSWARPGLTLPVTRSDGWRVTRVDVPAARTASSEQRYAIIEDGVWLTDDQVATTAYQNGQEVSWVDVAQCSSPGLAVSSVTATATGDATVSLSLTRAESGVAFDPTSFTWSAFDGSAVTADAPVIDATAGSAVVHLHNLPSGKHTLTVNAKDTAGAAADPAIASVWIEARPFDPRDTILYQVMIDRYAGPAGPLAPPATPSARAGGTIAGVQAALDAGKFAALGVNTLWLSPTYKNPTGTFAGLDGRQYSSYHGYWPIDPRGIEDLFGGEAAIDSLVKDAHARGVRVLFDVVPNHVHQQHPYAVQHMSDGWFDDVGGNCICGVGSCDWADNIQQCWFASYLPDLDWTNAQVADQVSSDVRWWIDRFDGDGVRIDAVPMMPRAATRRIVNAIRSRYDFAGHTSFILGENFTDETGYSLLKYELGPFGLNSEFHFPLMWALRAAISYAGDTSTNVQSTSSESGSGSGANTTVTSDGQTMVDVESAIAQGNQAWSGSGAVMTTMIGNHDVTRFATASSGEENGDSWTPAPQPSDPVVYAKQAFALATIFTLPGAPVIYYGDEIGLAGRSDPDSRRVMPSDAELIPAQVTTRAVAEKLGKLRACSDALRRGDYKTLFVDPEHLVYQRTLNSAGSAAADTVVVTLSRQPTGKLGVTLPGIAKGTYADVFAGGSASLDPELTNLDRAAFSVHVFAPSGSPSALSCVSTP